MQTQTAASLPQPLNGVDVAALSATIDAVRADARLADFQFRAHNRWLDGGHNRSEIRAFRSCGEEDRTRTEAFVLDADEPPVLLGRDAGANPVEYVLHALAACLTTTLAYHAAARGIAIRSVESRLEGDLDLRGFLGLSDDVRRGYRSVRVSMQVGCDVPAATLQELVRYSPVYDIVSGSLPVEVSITVC